MTHHCVSRVVGRQVGLEVDEREHFFGKAVGFEVEGWGAEAAGQWQGGGPGAVEHEGSEGAGVRSL